MKNKRKTKLTSLLTIAALAALALNVSAVMIVTDTFDNGGAAGADGALDLNQAARQVGSTVPVTYTATKESTPSAVDQSLLLSDQLLLRNLSDGGTAGSTQIANAGALIDQDLYSSLAGNHYTISYTGQMSAGGVTAGLATWYQSVTLGGAAGAPGLPELANADIGFAMRQDGAAMLYVDGVFTQWKAATGFAIDTPYSLTLDIDETTGTAFASVDVGGTVTTVDSVSFSFDAETSRRVQFQNRLITDTALPNIGGWDVLADAYVNDLQIEVIPEPATFGLFVLCGGVLFMARRAKRFHNS